MAEASDLPAWLPAAADFLLGGLFLRAVAGMHPRLHCCVSGFSGSCKAGAAKAGLHRIILLILAITPLHPRGAGRGGWPSGLRPPVILTPPWWVRSPRHRHRDSDEGVADSMPLRPRGDGSKEMLLVRRAFSDRRADSRRRGGGGGDPGRIPPPPRPGLRRGR